MAQTLEKTAAEANEGIFERCVGCKELTDVRIDQPVEVRGRYIEGAGQLCPGCHQQMYGEGIY